MKQLYFFAFSVLFIFTTCHAQIAYIPNNTGGDSIVSVVDLGLGTVLDTIIVGSAPAGVTIDNAGQRAYITNELAPSVSVVNTITHEVISTIDVENGPYGLTLSAAGDKLYVAHINPAVVSVINTLTNTVITTIPVGGSPRNVALSPDGGTLYVANAGADALTLIDTATDQVTGSISTGNNPQEVLVSADGNTLYVTNMSDDNVRVIDVATGNTLAVIATTDDNPYNMALAPDGTTLYVTLAFGSSSVDVIDLTTNTVVDNILVEGTPTGIDCTPDGTRIVVNNFGANSVSIIDAATHTVTTTIPNVRNAFGLGDFILGAAVAPGAALAFNGLDDRVSLPADGLLDEVTGDFTLSAWVKIDDNSVNQPVFSALRVGTLDVVTLHAASTFAEGKPMFFINSAESAGFVSGDTPLSTDAWHHLLVSYAADIDSVTLYVNGAAQGTTYLAESLASVVIEEAYLGYYPITEDIGGYFSGEMDEVRLLGSASSCFAVAQQAACELPSTDENLVLYYRFNQGEAGGDNTALTQLDAVAGPAGTLTGFDLTGDESNFIADGAITPGNFCAPVTETLLSVTHLATGTPVEDGDDTPTPAEGTDLGEVPLAGIVTSVFELTGDEVTEEAVSVDNPLFSFILLSDELLAVRFTPTEPGLETAVVRIVTDDCTVGDVFSFTVQGTGIVLPGDVCADPFDLNDLFGAPFNEPRVSELYNNIEFIANPSDPDYGYECFGEPDGGGGAPSLERTIWYTFTGDGNLYNITTVECNADFYIEDGNTQIAVYAGDCSAPVAVLCGEDTDADNLAASVDLATEPGLTYLMMIDGFGTMPPAVGQFCVQVTNLTEVSVTNPAEVTPLNLFPNPTTGTVRLPALTLTRLEVYDAAGRAVLVENAPATQVDLSALPAGWYALKLFGAREVYVGRVFKK